MTVAEMKQWADNNGFYIQASRPFTRAGKWQARLQGSWLRGGMTIYTRPTYVSELHVLRGLARLFTSFVEEVRFLPGKPLKQPKVVVKRPA